MNVEQSSPTSLTTLPHPSVTQPTAWLPLAGEAVINAAVYAGQTKLSWGGSRGPGSRGSGRSVVPTPPTCPAPVMFLPSPPTLWALTWPLGTLPALGPAWPLLHVVVISPARPAAYGHGHGLPLPSPSLGIHMVCSHWAQPGGPGLRWRPSPHYCGSRGQGHL